MQAIYSDGSIETEILNYLRQKADSKYNIIDELADSAVFHNFTKIRENLVNWYPFKEGSSILEIGAGMGALTGELCRKCKKVTALEASDLRASIIRERYKKLQNLEVVASDIFQYEPKCKFDYISLIGVLEYIGIYADDADPYEKLLKKCKDMLKPGGKLLLAIENKYGLKYWCGAAEDHTGIPFSGINNYKESKTGRYHADGVRTFSRNELKELLEHAGFVYQNFYYPLPDYKFPSVIFSDSCLPDEEVARGVKFMYPMESELVADERILYPEIIKNGQFPFFANSFFIIAAKENLVSENQKDIIAAYFKRDYKAQYQVATLVTKDYVIKRALSEEAQKHLNKAAQYTEQLAERGVQVVPLLTNADGLVMEFEHEPKAWEIVKNLFLKNEKEKILDMLDLLKDNLRKSSQKSCELNEGLKRLGVVEQDFDGILSDAYIDMTFINSFFSDGELCFFDQEWCIPGLPVAFILYRALVYAYPQENTCLPLSEFFSYIGISPAIVNIFEKFESSILVQMMDAQACKHLDGLMYRRELEIVPKARIKIENLQAHVNLLIRTENEYKQELKNKQDCIENLLESEQKWIQELKNKQDCIENLLDSGQKLKQELNDKKKRLDTYEESEQKLKQELKNKQGHIELLLETEREFERVKKSRTWRLAFKMQQLSALLFPLGSVRRLFVKMALRLFRHPRQALKLLSPRKIRHFFHFLKEEGAGFVSQRIDESMQGIKVTQEELDIQKEVEEKPFEAYGTLVFPQPKEPEVSIIIPVFNEFPYTYRCLQSVLEQSKDAVSYEVIVADDGSTDDTARLQEVVKNIRIIRNAQNLRFLKNCNHAAASARGKYLLFLNNDTQVQENWLEPLVRLMQKDPGAGIVGSKLVYADGRLQEAGGIVWDDASAWNYGNRIDAAKSEFNYVKEADYISGAALMVRAALWKETGGFDERFAPAYYEDTDLAFEARKRGYKVLYQPLSVVVHFEGISNGKDVSAGQKSYQEKNRAKFYEKWKDTLANEHYPNGKHVFLARDRAAGRKTLLVVDHYVPTYDKDAGSRCIFDYLKLFVSAGYNVKFIGDNFFKSEPYTTVLQQMGIEVLYGNDYFNNWKSWLRENGNYFDYVLLSRPHISIKYIDLVREYSHAKVIYFGHDLHFLREMREYRLTGKEQARRDAMEWKKTEIALMRKADVSYYLSQAELAEIAKLDATIKARRVPIHIYPKTPKAGYRANGRQGLLFVGGFGHPPNTDAVKWLVSEIMPLVWEKKPDMELHVAGQNPPPEIRELAGEKVLIHGFVPQEELEEMYQRVRLAVVPLRFGAGVKGKIIEGMLRGVPVVTTGIGIEGIEGAEGIVKVCESAEEIAETVVRLYEDEDGLEKMSGEEWRYIMEHFSVECAMEILREDFEL